MFLQLSHPPQHFRQFLERGDGSQPFACVERGRSADRGAGRDIVADATLRVNHRAIVNREMAGDAHLASQKDALAQDGGSGKTSLGTDNVVFADHAGVADLHQAIDLGAAADARLANLSLIHI